MDSAAALVTMLQQYCVNRPQYEDKRERVIDQRLAAVSDAITDVLPPGYWFTHGTRSVYPTPGINVEAFGPVSPPLATWVAKSLIDKCHLSPYGLKEQTLVDTSVRNTWELNTTQFSIHNPAWQPFIDDILEACRVPLGITNSATKIQAKLYKMLLYEAGGKFDKHQDSEKERGMFGTLVVVLPGVFTGGDLVVHDPLTASASAATSANASDKLVWRPGSQDPFAVKYAAFYGDCPHEVLPVTSGYRLCLTYNLVTVTSGEGEAMQLKFGQNIPSYVVLKDALSSYFTEDLEQKPPRFWTVVLSKSPHIARLPFALEGPITHRECQLVYILSDKCTASSLSMDHLNAKDTLIATSLRTFCEESYDAFELYLAKMLYKFEWTGEIDQKYGGDETNISENEQIIKAVALESTWVSCIKGAGENKSIIVRSPDAFGYHGVKVPIELEVAPCGFFTQDLDYDAVEDSPYCTNGRGMYTRWYASAALVLLPVWKRVALQFCANPVETLTQIWLPLVDTRPVIAAIAAEAFAQSRQHWSLVSSEGEAALRGVARLGNVASLRGLLHSCAAIEYQPMLHDIVRQFSETDAVSLVNDQVLLSHFDYAFIKRRVATVLASCLRPDSDPKFTRLLVG